MNEMKNLKWIAIGILVGYLTPYLFAYLKSKQETPAQQEQASHG